MLTLERKDGTFRGETATPLEWDSKSINEQGEFEGYLSVFNNMDGGGDICVAGCFAESLQKRPAARVKLLAHHDSRRPVGVWTELAEDGRGLRAKGRILLTTQDGRDTYELMKAGALDGLSIGYRTLKDEIDRATGTRKLLKVDLMEGSVVTFPMNERATISTVKTLADLTTEDMRDMEAALREAGLSRADARKAITGFKNWSQCDAEGPGTGQCDADAAADTQTLLALRRLTAALRG